MKPIQNTKSNHTHAASEPRPVLHRAGAGKVITHRYERRKSREQLRRIDLSAVEDWG
jgi:hypothetical protein